METLVYPTKKGNAATDTRRVAKAFGKSHANVLKAVDALEVSPEFDGVNFYANSYTDRLNRQKRQVMMTRAGFVRLVMSFTGKKAAAFKEQYITQFDEMETELRGIKGDVPLNLLDHAQREVQVANSKGINHHHYLIGGVKSVVVYNRENCRLHTGKHPNELKADAKLRGVASKIRSSAKELLRHESPETACSMSLADEMVRHGATLAEAAEVSIAAKKVFAGMMRLGFRPAQLSA